MSVIFPSRVGGDQKAKSAFLVNIHQVAINMAPNEKQSFSETAGCVNKQLVADITSHISSHLISHLIICSPAVQRGLEPGGGGLPEDQLQPRELRQRPTLLQEPQRKHRLTHHLQTSGLCARGAKETTRTRQGKCSSVNN